MAKTDQYQDWQAANQQREDEARAVARQATGFDCHAAIRELAKVEWVRKSMPDFEGDPPGSIGTQSMEAPFVSLRVPCPHIGNRGEAAKWHQGCVCEGRRWVPEPDVEKACWQVIKVLLDQEIVRGAFTHVGSIEEAALRAALTWADKRGAEKPMQ